MNQRVWEFVILSFWLSMVGSGHCPTSAFATDQVKHTRPDSEKNCVAEDKEWKEERHEFEFDEEDRGNEDKDKRGCAHSSSGVPVPTRVQDEHARRSEVEEERQRRRNGAERKEEKDEYDEKEENEGKNDTKS